MNCEIKCGREPCGSRELAPVDSRWPSTLSSHLRCQSKRTHERGNLLSTHFSHSRSAYLSWLALSMCNTNRRKVWHDLGLELRLELDALRSNRTPSATSMYYIQHAQQHSGLFVPKGVPCGYFSELSCSFRYSAKTSSAPETAGESIPRSRANTYYNLRKLARTPPTEPCSVNIATFWDLSHEVQAERVVYLTQNALNLMLGMRKRCLGIRFLRGTKPPALLEIAPAVWNARHFQVSKFDSFTSPSLTWEFRMSSVGRS